MLDQYIEKLEELITEITNEKIKIEVVYDNITEIAIIKGYNYERSCKILITNEFRMKVYYKCGGDLIYVFDEEDERDKLCQNIILNLLNI